MNCAASVFVFAFGHHVIGDLFIVLIKLKCKSCARLLLGWRVNLVQSQMGELVGGQNVLGRVQTTVSFFSDAIFELRCLLNAAHYALVRYGYVFKLVASELKCCNENQLLDYVLRPQIGLYKTKCFIKTISV